MREFLTTYIELLQNNHDLVGQVHSEFKRQFLEMTVDKLLEQFVLNKYTGLEKPGLIFILLISSFSFTIYILNNKCEMMKNIGLFFRNLLFFFFSFEFFFNFCSINVVICREIIFFFLFSETIRIMT